MGGSAGKVPRDPIREVPPEACHFRYPAPFSPACLTPTSYEYNHEELFFREPEIIDFGGLEGPRGRPDPKNRGFLGPGNRAHLTTHTVSSPCHSSGRCFGQFVVCFLARPRPGGPGGGSGPPSTTDFRWVLVVFVRRSGIPGKFLYVPLLYVPFWRLKLGFAYKGAYAPS